MASCNDFFQRLTGYSAPYTWQSVLCQNGELGNRLIRIPTGFGKTHGVLAAWLWHRMQRQDECWPRRLVWCLPMRVLVEQIESEVRSALEALDLLWDGGSHGGKVGVHALMGGVDSGDWSLYPEECAVLIGTQDMLLSRALNRGYGASRARWPMEFGLLNHDVLWVMDEVQLMDVGLATSAQLQVFRGDESEQGEAPRPSHTWWMSATLQPEWLKKSPDTAQLTTELPLTAVPPADRSGHLWDDVTKPCQIIGDAVKDAGTIAVLVAQEHQAMDRSRSGPTLVVMNTVRTAIAVYDKLSKNKSLKATDIRLVHSRFRPVERAVWRDAFLNKAACGPGTDRIIVATQVVEAGVDISASLLITEIAPWASLVQRFGRCARWGGSAKVVVVDLPAKQAEAALARAKKNNAKDKEGEMVDVAETKAALPYALAEIRAARKALGYIDDVAPKSLELFEEEHPEWLPRLYPYAPSHLLLRHELDELFDTAPDLSGADIDISRFIRSGDERDLQVFWAVIEDKSAPTQDVRPTRDALCSVPFLAAKIWLCGKGSTLMKSKRAWVWDWLEGAWRRAEGRDFYPGQILLVDAKCGGYDLEKGWDDKSSATVEPVPQVVPRAAEKADAIQDDESLSKADGWQTIALHGREVGRMAQRISGECARSFADLYDLAGRVHDIGKSHAVFQGQIVADSRPARHDLAKAPHRGWSRSVGRPGFRHELASVLALFAVLQRHCPDHPGLLGPWRELLSAAGTPPVESEPIAIPPTTIEEEIIALSGERFNLLLYLVCAHHGKIRLTWHACPADQKAADCVLRIRGIRNGETLPALTLYSATGKTSQLPGCSLDLLPAVAGLNPKTGPGWTERVLALLESYGPFRLAWFEAIMRAADQRASMTVSADEMLKAEVAL